MPTYAGSLYGFNIEETVVNPSTYLISVTFTSAPTAANVYQLQYRVIGDPTWISSAPFYMNNPGTLNVDAGNNEYRIQLFYSDSTPFEYISTTLIVPNTDNFLYIPELTPVIFFEEGKTNIARYNTKHFNDFGFKDRQAFWQQYADWKQVWQTTDIINLQFESTFDPIVVELLDDEGNVIVALPALIGLPNTYYPNMFSFEVNLSLGGLTTGCYQIRITAGTGATQKILLSGWQHISSDPIEGTIYIEYKNSRYHKDVLFETGILFGYRTYGWINYDGLEKPRKDEFYRDQIYNPSLLNSKSSKLIPIHFGNWEPTSDIDAGLPPDELNKIENIVSCDTVTYDGVLFGLGEGEKFEFNREENYRLTGVMAKFELGLNRNSRIFMINTDTTKKMMVGINVEGRVFGDLANQGSSNTLPINKIV